jgi:hypothetical protein
VGALRHLGRRCIRVEDHIDEPQLDQSTGTATLVGSFNIGVGPNSDLRGAAFDTKNGILYAASSIGAPGDLYWIDVTNGSAQHIAELSSATETFGGLAYESKRDQLVWLQPSSDLAVINRSTGVATPLFDLPGIVPSTEGLTYGPEKDLLWASVIRAASLRSWVKHYDHERPHRSLGKKPPMARLRAARQQAA